MARNQADKGVPAPSAPSGQRPFGVEPVPVSSIAATPNADTYRGWNIHEGRWPEPAWMATGPNYDASYEGEEDGWRDNGEKADGPTREALIDAIDEWLEENVAEPDEVVWLRDLDGTGSMHPCTPDCPGALRYVRADA